MKKKFLCLILTLVMVFCLVPSAVAANDEATQAAQMLYELGLFRGTGTNPDGTPIFDLDKTPTRNQAVIMLVRLLGKEEEALAGNWELPFTDVAKGSAAYPYIGYAYANGLTNGTTATTYSGTNPIKANQYITFVLRSLGYTSGKDFAVSTAWEFSDKIGLTDGRYDHSIDKFLRGDVALISYNALSINQKGTVVSLQQKLDEEKQGGYRAWYYVDEQGSLSIRTNIDARDWNGFSVVVLNHYADGSWGFDTQGGQGDIVSYDCNSLFSHNNHGTILRRTELFVLENSGSGMEFWELYKKTGNHQKALGELGEKHIASIDLNTRLRVNAQQADFQLIDVKITYDDAQMETYTAAITGEIKLEGEYGLFYRGKSGDQYAGMSYIGRGDGVLTYTREMNHFAPPGASGTFHISYCTHSMNEKNEFVCTKYVSNGVDYVF